MVQFFTSVMEAVAHPEAAKSRGRRAGAPTSPWSSLRPG